MNTVVDLEKEISVFPPAERERLATVAWESLVGDRSAAGDRNIDPAGIEIAAQSDARLRRVTFNP